MNWSKLPKEYRDLEKNFNKDCRATDSESLFDRFSWNYTPQRGSFWLDCLIAKNISELPPITVTHYPEEKSEKPIKPKKQKNRYFIVFWRNSEEMGHTQIITNGCYIMYTDFYNKREAGTIITNIIELSESDYNDFIKDE